MRDWLRDPRSWWFRWLLAALLVAAVLVVIRALRPVWTPFLIAVGIAYLVDPIVEWMVIRRLNRSLAILVTYLFLGLCVAGVVAFVVPVLIGELDRLGQTLPNYASEVERQLHKWEGMYARTRLPEGVRGVLDQNVRHLQGVALAAVNDAVGNLLNLFAPLVSLFVAPVLAFYLLSDLPRLKQQVVRWLPAQWRSQLLSYFADVDETLSGYVRGQLLMAASIGLLVTLAMFALRVQYAVILGLIAGAGELVPYFGPILGAVPAILVGLLQSPRLGMEVLAAYLVIQWLEGAVLGPAIMRQTVGLHPLAVVFALLAGGHLLGVIGVLLAVPVAGVVKVTGVHVYRWLSG